ncbi:MAG: multidrug transporter AcrB [Sphingobacteriales bacterium SCN 48-20]|uniref:efflux RND transporter permease subunit n=1 Tax=Terrimonas ferruginea TaxID=249 RepID=UPI00086F0319|nr:efflux RND transporter permease subunit [Terrimonas ferruginea]MBN8785131.1 efflux RND transporter permease subunit [Terrimonas ferruginea]ODT90485.1 MAG: multidrug transporter AcrB [Sphingobacteriales bacterium SCN 48-20]OJW41564.1 MAG: multidrug transporter AcrB [Sphingobacteriales bacterium 48-107]
MKIAQYAIKNYQFTLIMVLMIVSVGISTVLTMPRSEDPELNAPMFPVVVVYPGTSPKDMEELVVKPLEKKLYGLDNIKRIKTSIHDGLALLFVEYRFNSNVDDKYQEVVREVSAMRSQLPPDLYSIDVQKIDPSNVNILQMALVSENAPRDKLRKAAEDLEEVLEKIPSLKNVEIQGIPDPTIRVDLALDKLAQLHLPVTVVAGALQGEITNIPGGSINEGSKSFNIKTNGTYQSIGEIENTVLATGTGRTIFLKDVAKVYFDYSQEKHITRLNGHRCITIVAALKKGENISNAQKEYLKPINNFKEKLPANMDLVLHFDQADNVNSRLGHLGVDFMIAIGLVLLTLLPLGMRASLVVMIAVPLSLGIGIIFINMLGYNLNQLSIVGLVVALGLLVDDSIVVVENIERWMRNGYSRLEATLKATNQIGMAVLGCTATLIIAFMPLAFMPESSGEFIRSLPVAVIATIFASMIVALTIVPFLSSRLLKPHANEHGNFFLRGLQKLIHGTYAKLLDRALKHPWKTLAVGAAIFVGSLMLIPVIGSSLFPASEKPQFLIDITAPLQSNIYHTDSLTKQIEKELRKIPEIRYFASNTGKGNPRIYYNVNQQNEQSNFAEIFVQLQPDVRPDKKIAIIEMLRNRWTPYPGAKVEVKNFEQGQPMISPVEVRLLGENLDTLSKLASEVETLLKQTEGTIYVNNPIRNLKSDIRVFINKEKAQMLGVPTVNITRTVRMAVAGFPVGNFTNPNRDNDDYTIVLGVPGKSYPDLTVFDNLYVNNVQGKAIPLNQLATIGMETSPLHINHFNKTRTVSVTAFVRKGYLNSEVIDAVIAKLNQKKLPDNYRYEMGGEVEGKSESFSGFGKIILVTVFMFIAVLVLQFRTFKSTLIVLSVIPLGIVGAVLALLVTGNSLSFVATIGIVALAGIEVKNTILLVDFTNQLRAEGKPLMEAIEEAGEARFLPIILTSLTAIGGLLPIALSSNPLISPLAIVMIGGLISSTLLSRIVTPVIYKLMPPKVEVKVKQPL